MEKVIDELQVDINTTKYSFLGKNEKHDGV